MERKVERTLLAGVVKGGSFVATTYNRERGTEKRKLEDEDQSIGMGKRSGKRERGGQDGYTSLVV